MQALPNFFIAGAPKAGTTSLYHYLDQHPQIYMSPIKEPCHFASELRPENFDEEEQPRIQRDMRALKDYLSGSMSEKRFGGLVANWDDYLKLFRNVRGEKAIGEASVCYLWSETAARNIHSRIPDATILMVLRNPADRAFSQYLHGVSIGLIRRSFREQVDAALRSNTTKFGSTYPFLEFGLYSGQVTRYLRLFPRDRVGIYLYDDFRKDPTAIVPEILRLLSVEDDVVLAMTRKHLEPRVPRFRAAGRLLTKYGTGRLVKRLTPGFVHPLLRRIAFTSRNALVMKPVDRSRLIDYYRDDIHRLADLLNRDLSMWLTGA